jgi:hypothetical protein
VIGSKSPRTVTVATPAAWSRVAANAGGSRIGHVLTLPPSGWLPGPGREVEREPGTRKRPGCFINRYPKATTSHPNRPGQSHRQPTETAGCLTRFGSCLRVTGRSTRHDPLARPSRQYIPADTEPLPGAKASCRRCAVRLTVPPPSGIWQLPGEAPARRPPGSQAGAARPPHGHRQPGLEPGGRHRARLAVIPARHSALAPHPAVTGPVHDPDPARNRQRRLAFAGRLHAGQHKVVA